MCLVWTTPLCAHSIPGHRLSVTVTLGSEWLCSGCYSVWEINKIRFSQERQHSHCSGHPPSGRHVCNPRDDQPLDGRHVRALQPADSSSLSFALLECIWVDTLRTNQSKSQPFVAKDLSESLHHLEIFTQADQLVARSCTRNQ